jgi:ABC-type transport system involved in multi-copper enzyme maturation permease subunit
MLWYKAWLETRSRFAIALVGCVAFCLLWVVEFGKGIVASQGRAGLFNLFHVVQLGLSFCWILAATFLMMGGLLQEKTVGASSFSLALPVSRMRLMSVRFGVGLVQAVALAVIPWMGMLAYGKLVGYQYPLSQVCFHVFLLLSGGVVFLSIAFLISSVVEGQYTAPVVSIGVSAVLAYALRGERLAAYNPGRFMEGAEGFSWRTGLLTGHAPFLHAAGFGVVAALLFMISVKAIERYDF